MGRPIWPYGLFGSHSVFGGFVIASLSKPFGKGWAQAVIVMVMLLLCGPAFGQAGLIGAAADTQQSGQDASASAPVILDVAVVPGQANLSFATSLPSVAHFRINRSRHLVGDWNTLATVNADITDYADATISKGTSYDYEVDAVDSKGHLLGKSAVELAGKTNFLDVFEGRVIGLKDMTDPAFWQNAVNTIVLGTLGFIPKFVSAVILFAIFYLIYRMIRRIVIGSMKRAHVDASIREMLASLIKWSIMGFALVIACNQIGLEIAALLTGVSIIGLAIGFAAQETLANFIAGVVIFWDKPFRIGDWIVIDGMFGQILRVSFRSTRMLNLNGETIVMPNTYMLSNRVANHSTHPHVRIEIPIGIAYKDSIDDARRALLATLADDMRVCSNPNPEVVVIECAASSVNLMFRIWITDEAAEKSIFCEYLEKAKKALDTAGIEIPFPQMQLLLDKSPVLSALTAGVGDATGD
jgi:small conductance mechanosensitive channel